MSARRRRRRLISLVAVAALACGIGVLAQAVHLLCGSELQTIDARFSVRGPRRPYPKVVLVEIENIHELAPLGLKSQYPFLRRYDAEVIDHLREAGAKVIAMDLEFSQQTDVTDDNDLIEAIGRARGRTVLAATEIESGGETHVLGGSENVRRFGARAADARLTLDPDGVVRRFAHGYEGLPSFAVVSAELDAGHSIPASLFEAGTLPIDFAGAPGRYPSISYAQVLHGRFDPGLFRGKIVIVGASAPILQDVHATATSGSSEMTGSEIWANSIATLLRGVPLRNAPGWLNLLLILALGTAAPLASLRLRRWRSMALALLLALGFTLATQLAFDGGVILGYVYPLLALAVGTLGTLGVLYVGEAIERERVRDVFARFVPADVVDHVLASADDNLRLGGVERDCTVLFSDLRGFTSFSETQPAARVIEVVNFYLNEMTEAIHAAGGTLIAYMGDGIMAVFGAPLEQPDHADRAVAAAREMIGPRLQRFNAWLTGQGFPSNFAMGVGLNSGPVMAGNVGSQTRVEYTAIGDTTNTASRLEGMTKDSGTMLFVSASTRERMRTGVEQLTLFGEVEVRGRVNKLAVWTIWPGDGSDGKLPAVSAQLDLSEPTSA